MPAGRELPCSSDLALPPFYFLEDLKRAILPPPPVSWGIVPLRRCTFCKSYREPAGVPVLLKPICPQAIFGIGRDDPFLSASDGSSYIGKMGDSCGYPRVTTSPVIVGSVSIEHKAAGRPEAERVRPKEPVVGPFEPGSFFLNGLGRQTDLIDDRSSPCRIRNGT